MEQWATQPKRARVQDLQTVSRPGRDLTDIQFQPRRHCGNTFLQPEKAQNLNWLGRGRAESESSPPWPGAPMIPTAWEPPGHGPRPASWHCITRDVRHRGDSPRGKLHSNAYVSLQSGRAGRKAHYGRPAKATGRLARRVQQDPAASRPVRGGIEQRVDHRGTQHRQRAGPRARTPGTNCAGPPSHEPSHRRASSTAPSCPVGRGPSPPRRESAAAA